MTHSSSSSSISGAAQRKRPGCLCDDICYGGSTDSGVLLYGASASTDYYDDDDAAQPLDLSLPKIKVRQHWSGGSIVQVNDSTIISIGADYCDCPAKVTDVPAAAPASRLNVSVVTVPPQHSVSAATSRWMTPATSAHSANRHYSERHSHLAQPPVLPVHYPQSHEHHHQPLRVQIEIPLVGDTKLTSYLHRPQQQQQQRQQQQQSVHHHRRKSNNVGHHYHHHPQQQQQQVVGSAAASRPAEVNMAADTEEDDLKRLTDSAQQLRLSGYYYPHLSWKDSIQLLQNTRVGFSSFK